MRKLLVLLVCLIGTCSPLPAQQTPLTSEPMVPLRICEEELTLLEQKSLAQVTKLEADFVARLRTAVEGAAADAVRPLLADLAGVRAERDVWKSQARNGVVMGIAGWAFGVACLTLTIVHFFLPQTLTVP